MTLSNILIVVLAAVCGPAAAAPLNKGVPSGPQVVKAAAAPQAAVPALPLGLPQAPQSAVPVQPGMDKTALPGLQSEAARMETAAQAGRPDAGGANASFDGSGQLSAAATPAELAELNKAVAETLAPYNNALTKAVMVFNRVETNAQRATHVDLTVDYAKKGQDGDAAVKVDRLVYAYPEGGEPKTDGRIALEFPLRNVMTQDQINQLGPQADKLVGDFLRRYASRYGQAATIDARITRKDVDAQGNLTAIAFSLGAKIDMAKLPAKVDPKDVEFKQAQLNAEITLAGASLSFAVTSNVLHRSFERGQTGLKEALDQLVARDPKALRSLAGFIRSIDQLATNVTTDQNKERQKRMLKSRAAGPVEPSMPVSAATLAKIDEYRFSEVVAQVVERQLALAVAADPYLGIKLSAAQQAALVAELMNGNNAGTKTLVVIRRYLISIL